MTMPHVGDDDLYHYMHEIIEKEFPKALRQALKTLWDNKYALIYGPFDSACHRFRLFHALNSNTLIWLFPNQVSSAFQRPSNPVSSISFEDLDLVELKNVILDDVFPGRNPYLSFDIPWKLFSRNPEIPDVDKRLFATAIDQLRAIKAEHVNGKGIMNPQLLKRQLAQARGVFAAFNVTLNDSKNTFDFSAAGLQNLMSERSAMQSLEPLSRFSEHRSDLLCSEDNALDTAVACERTKTSSLERSAMQSLDPLSRFSEHRSDLLCSEDNALDTAVACERTQTSSLDISGSGFEAHEPQFFYFEKFGYFRAFSSEQVRRDLNIWVKGKYLGGGNFGKVFRLTHRESGIKVAMKEVKMEPQYSELPEGVKQLENELVKLRRLSHPRIVRVHGSEQKGNFIYLFLDFMAGGSLRDFIRQRGILDEQLTREFTQQILEGVDYLHSNDIIHRDIKGPNVLLDSDRSVKLADFGVSRTIQKIGTKTDLKSYVGTTYWMAPEILWGKGYGRKVDIWSVGCTVVEMLTGDPPLRNLEPQAAMFCIGSKPLEVKLPESTEKARDFVRAALTWNPTERPNCKELLTHPFVKELDEELLLRAATQAEDSNNQERKKQKGKRKGSRQVSSLAYAQHPGVQTGKRQRKKR